MKKTFTMLFAMLLITQLFAQNEKDEEEKVSGFRFAGIPVVAFDADLGLQYGALTNLYFYGDGSQYPDYRHSIYMEMSRFTKGSGINRLFYDSQYLIPNIRVTSDLSYLTEQAFGFYGFNGAQTAYNPEWLDTEDGAYKSRLFYRHARERFRFLLDFQGKLKSDKLRWVAGFTHYNDHIGSVDINKLNEGKDEDLLPTTDSVPGLYELYKQWGIINTDELEGGMTNYLKLGIVYDTRDNEPHPMSGIWAEGVIFTAPGFLGNDHAHTLLNLTFRQYFTVIKNDLSFAYRLGVQSTISGSAPFYMKPNVVTTMLRSANSEGLGGSKTIRGVILNRIVGDGIAMANAELRWKFLRFKFINQNFYLGLNAFADAGQVIQETDVDLSNVPADEFGHYFTGEKEKLHLSYGLGFRIAVNQNFIIAADYGFAASKEDGTSGMYIGLNYLF